MYVQRQQPLRQQGCVFTGQRYCLQQQRCGESELNTGDAERLKYLHISPVNLIFLLKPASGMSGTGREAVCIDTELSGNEYLMMRQAFKKMGINLKRDKLSFTKRETHVINMILNGYSIDEISRSLLISKKTVQSFVGIVLQEEPASLGCPIN